MPPKLTREIVMAAIDGFEQQKQRIDTQIAELRAMLPGGATGAAVSLEAPVAKRRVSAAGRRRMALAQKARWAKIKGESELATPQDAAKPKRKLSAKGRRAISEATKRRLALKRAEAAKASLRKSAVRKKATMKASPAKAAKKSTPVKKVARRKATAKKTATPPAQAVTEAAAQ